MEVANLVFSIISSILLLYYGYILNKNIEKVKLESEISLGIKKNIDVNLSNLWEIFVDAYSYVNVIVPRLDRYYKSKEERLEVYKTRFNSSVNHAQKYNEVLKKKRVYLEEDIRKEFDKSNDNIWEMIHEVETYFSLLSMTNKEDEETKQYYIRITQTYPSKLEQNYISLENKVRSRIIDSI